MTPHDINDLTGQVALVTGASRGIGAAIAEWLKGMGADVFGTATSDTGAQDIASRLGEGRGLVMDLLKPDTITTALTELNERSGHVSVLVNNAAITRDQLLMRLSDEDWDAVIEANLTGTMRVTRACLRGMLKARAGRIVLISSVVGAMGNPGQTNYAAAKAGVAGFGRALAQEVASRSITCNTIAPGFIATDMTAALSEEQTQRMTAGIPLQCLGEPKDIAACVGFLVGPGGRYITGQTLHVNGGLYMT